MSLPTAPGRSPHPRTAGAAAAGASLPRVLMPPPPHWQDRAREDEGKPQFTHFPWTAVSPVCRSHKKANIRSADLIPLQSRSLQRAQAAFDSKTSHPYFQFLQQANKIWTRFFLPSPSFPLERENWLRATLPPPQTGATGSIEPLNTTNPLRANDGTERPRSQAALCLSHMKMAFVPRAVWRLCPYAGAGRGVFHSCHGGSCLWAGSSISNASLSRSHRSYCFHSLGAKRKNKRLSGEKSPQIIHFR